MKITLDIEDRVMREVKAEVARPGTTMSEFVEAALRRMLESEPTQPDLEPLPTFSSGGALVDFCERHALFEIFDSD